MITSLINMTILLWLWTAHSFSISANKPDYRATGNASTFYPKEKWNNGKFACGGDWEDASLPVCAHRTLPCGTWVLVENKKTKDTAWCQVRDRGPYGATTPEGKWVLKRPKDSQHKNAKYRSLIDLAPTVSEAVGTRGWGQVTIKTWHRKQRRRAISRY